jgi:hypothetical protein
LPIEKVEEINLPKRTLVEAMTPFLSDAASDKLQAVLTYAARNPDDALGADYRQAVAAWFARLSGYNKLIATWVVEAYADGREAAERVAAHLPRAPKCPL